MSASRSAAELCESCVRNGKSAAAAWLKRVVSSGASGGLSNVFMSPPWESCAWKPAAPTIRRIPHIRSSHSGVRAMTKAKTRTISARKRPRQARSIRLVEDILEGAARVLARRGARHFTTERVAEEAGVSIGSLYQYFPSKEALLFRLQTDEWHETWAVLDEILSDLKLSP